MALRINRAAVNGLVVSLFVALPVALAVWTLETLVVPTPSDRLGYTLADIRSAKKLVPKVYFVRLPSGLPEIRSAKQRKNLFIRIMLPLILKVNDDILADRGRLLTLEEHINAGHELPQRDVKWLSDLAIEYRVKDADMAELLNRVDAIPPSLALAQSAIESGWGTSRFAQQGNALYGQWTYGGDGLVPDRRDEGKDHRIKAFPRLIESVVGYARNLNTHAAYGELRATRARRYAGQERASGIELAETLVSYSERGVLYIDDLRTIILSNGLLDFDASGFEG